MAAVQKAGFIISHCIVFYRISESMLSEVFN